MSAIAIALPEFGESDWDDLLDLVEENKVAPVIGSGVLPIGTDTGTTYPSELANRVAGYLKVSSGDLPAGRELHTVASRYLARGGQPDRLYAAINRMASEPQSVPQPLTELAEITDLRLFLTTNFDGLLASALKQTRSMEPVVRTYRLERWEDVSDLELSSARPIVYHLFGKLTAVPNEFAITEEDTLEFMHALQSESRRPPGLFGELDQRALLVLGCRFPNWLARFFLRIPCKERLSSPMHRPYFVTEHDLDADGDEVLFLQQFSKATRIHPGIGPAEFITELNHRWKQRRAKRSPVAPESAAAHVAAKAEVFLSYASEDRETVKAIWRALDGAGIPAFFDKVNLEEGEEYRGVFERQIHECALFIPVISRHTLTEDRRFFRIEWRTALDEALKKSFDPAASFVFPVIIDDTPPDHPALPQYFAQIDASRLTNGVVSPEFVDRVRDIYKRNRRPGN